MHDDLQSPAPVTRARCAVASTPARAMEWRAAVVALRRAATLR